MPLDRDRSSSCEHRRGQRDVRVEQYARQTRALRRSNSVGFCERLIRTSTVTNRGTWTCKSRKKYYPLKHFSIIADFENCA